MSETAPLGPPESAPSAEQIVDALACHREGCACVAAARKGQGLTHCPSHEDGSPSLNVTWGNGRVLVHCHSGGCTQREVLDALREKGLWPQRPVVVVDDIDPEEFLKGTPASPAPPRSSRVTPPSTPAGRLAAEAAWRSWGEKTGLPRPAFERMGVRYEERWQALCFPFAGLSCVKYRPWPPRQGAPKYLWDKRYHQRPPLWPIPDTRSVRPTILLTAGETDCATLNWCDFPAFAISKGEHSGLNAHHVRGLLELGVTEVVFVFDADAAGDLGAHKAAWEVADLDMGLGVRVALLPSEVPMAGGKDVNDLWHHSGRDRRAFKAAVEAMLAAAAPWTQESVPAHVLRQMERQAPRVFAAQRARFTRNQADRPEPGAATNDPRVMGSIERNANAG